MKNALQAHQLDVTWELTEIRPEHVLAEIERRTGANGDRPEQTTRTVRGPCPADRQRTAVSRI